jgi:hypothetical protein
MPGGSAPVVVTGTRLLASGNDAPVRLDGSYPDAAAPRVLALRRVRAAPCQVGRLPRGALPNRVPLGDESYWEVEGLAPLERCPDCWARRGQPHHSDCIRAYCEPCDDHI